MQSEAHFRLRNLQAPQGDDDPVAAAMDGTQTHEPTWEMVKGRGGLDLQRGKWWGLGLGGRNGGGVL